MKINNFGPRGINPYQQQQYNRVQQQEQTARNKADKVEISTAAKDLQQLSTVEKERAAKVNKIKSEIDNGTYKIDSRQIAEKILHHYESMRK